MRRLAWIITGVEALLLVPLIVISAANGSFSSEGGFIGTALLMMIGYGGIGGYLAARLPDNPIGWLMLVVSGAFALAGLSDEWMTYTYVTNPGLPGAEFGVADELGLHPVYLGHPVHLGAIPTGHPPSPRWRWLLGAYSAALTIGLLGTILRPGIVDTGTSIEIANPTGIGSLRPAIGVVLLLAGAIALATGLAAVAAPFVRFRRAGGEERQQLRWLAYVTAAGGAALIVAIISGIGLGAEETRPANEIAFFVLFALLGIGVPAAIGVALLKYRLWDLDIVLKKAVVAAIVVVAIAILSVLVLVVVGGALVGPIGDRPGLTLLAGLAIGAALWPILRASRRVADRFVYGGRATPYEVLTDFAERLAEAYSTEDVVPRMASIVAAGTRAERVTIWLLVGGELRPAGSWPSGSDEGPAPAASLQDLTGDAFVVRHQGEQLGAITVSMPANDPMNPSREKLMRDLAGQAGLVLRNVRLIEELRASRRRLVAAQDEERRRLERNIRRRAAAARRPGGQASARRPGRRARPREGAPDALAAAGGSERRAREPEGPRARDLPAAARGQGAQRRA
jgi:hypothetical protein